MLKKITLSGFKSFGRKTVLTFDQPFTVIVGPNGSGKSNIADAVRWVLGEQSARRLRGGKMEDIIFGGTDTKKPLNMAQVSLLFDNSEGRLPVSYDEVQVTRKLFRSGETEYAINQTSCRLRDVRELFLDTGIGKEGYSLIGQGEIEQILSARDEERRDLFEEATGIARHRYQIVDAGNKLRRTEENLVRVEDILTGLTEQESYLARESEKAKRGLALTAELEKHTVAFYRKEILQLQEEIRKMQRRQEELTQWLQEADAACETAEKDHEKAADALQKATEQWEALQEKHREVEQKELVTRNRSELLEQSISMRETERRRRATSIAEKESATETLRKRTDSARQEIEESQTQIAGAAERLAQSKRQSEVLQADWEQVQERQTALKSEWEGIEKQMRQVEIRMAANADIQLRHADRSEKLAQRLTEEKERWEEAKRAAEQADRDAQEKKQKHAQAVERLQKAQQALEEMRLRLDQHRIDRSRIRQECETLQTRLSTLEAMERNHEGYFRPVQQLLQEADRNREWKDRFLGPLGRLIRVDEEVSTAIEVALGAALHHVVTETAEDAKVLIEWLRNKRVGRVTFLPIDSMRGDTRSVSLPVNEAGAVGAALQFVHADAKYRKILQSLLARTFLVEDVDAGLAIRRTGRYGGLRLVTRKGDILHASGSMVGGFVAQEGRGILTREPQRDRLTKEYENATERWEEASRLWEEWKEIQAKRETAVAEAEQFARVCEKEHSDANARREAVRAQADVLQRQVEQWQQQAQTEDPSNAQELLQASLDTLRAKAEEWKTLLAESEARIRQLSEERMAVRSEHSGAEAAHDALERDIVIRKNRLLQWTEEYERSKDSLDREKQTEEEDRRAHVEAVAEREACAAALEALREERSQMETEMQSHRLVMKECTEQATAAAQEKERQETERNAMQRESEMLRFRRLSQEERWNERITSIADEMGWEQAEVLPRMQAEEPFTTTRSALRDLREALRKLGPFSADSIEMYEQVAERVLFLTTQAKDLRASKEDLLRVIASLEKAMRLRFAEGIREINEQFQRIFRILFDGGTASLSLEGDDVLESKIKIIARPPGKTLQNLNLLSGGEKAMTAVALLFAIFETRPSPFCVLDEIDAALDEANIHRYRAYLESFRGRIQFIIITHRRQTMEVGDVLYGVTMEDSATSRIIPLSLADKKEESA